MRSGAFTALVALVVVDNSTGFVAPRSGFVPRSVAAHASTAATATMSLDNRARVALGTFLAGAAVIFSGGDVALADGSTTKFSLPPVGTGKDRCDLK